MHWLIPAVSHSFSCAFAWRLNTLTNLAIALSILLAAAQSFHRWSAFYGLFALYFALGTQLVLFSRSSKNGTPRKRNALQLLAQLGVAVGLVLGHHFYLEKRIAGVPWFHIFRAKAGCFPIPSRTLHVPIKWTYVDALGNQIPFGIVASYAAAMAWMFSASVRGSAPTGVLRTAEVVAAVAGALTVALTAAYALPFCGEDVQDGKHEVMMHVDRSVEWHERYGMAWSNESRYGVFVAALTLTGTLGAVIAARLTSAFTSVKVTPSKPAATAQPVNEKAKSGKSTSTTQTSQTIVATSPVDDDAVGTHLASFVMHILIAASVILGMAVWSYTGPRADQLDMSEQGVRMPLTDDA